MHRIILLSGSRQGTHYICNLFYDNLNVPDIAPEVLHIEQWNMNPRSNRLNNTIDRFDLSTIDNIKEKMKFIVKNSENFIVKYWIQYLLSVEEMKNLRNQTDAKFVFLYRENIVDTIISYIVISIHGYLDDPLYKIKKSQLKKIDIDKVIRFSLNMYKQMNDTYILFKDDIDTIVKYEDFKNDKNDLRLIGIDIDVLYNNTKKVVTPLVKEQIKKFYKLDEILMPYRYIPDYNFITKNFKYDPVNTQQTQNFIK